MVELKPKAEILIQALKQRGIQLALTTTTSLYNIQRYQENNKLINSKIDFTNDFTNDFSSLLTREHVDNIKPHPEVYLKALRHFNVRPEQCLIIEDSLIGVEAAKMANIEVAAIYDQYSAHESDLIKTKANYYVEDFAALLNYIN